MRLLYGIAQISGDQTEDLQGEHITLNPLLLNGRDALDPAGIPPIAEIRLQRIKISYDNDSHETIVRETDDIFHSAPRETPSSDPLPPDATLTQAAFAVRFADSPEPRIVEILLPATIKLEQAGDAPWIETWLLKRGFAAAQKAFRLSLLALLAFVSACGPAIDDDDDLDDEDPDRIIFSTAR